MEDFVTFEIAKKLKEKGFKQGYNTFGYQLVFSDENTIKYISNIGAYETEYYVINVLCPTISQVLKWLRDEKKIHVEIDIMKAYPEAKLIYWGYNIVLIDKYEVNHSEWNSNSFEQAALAGIEYVIDNLM
jgi:hypothetical protein